MRPADTRNEITAIAALLAALRLTGAIVTHGGRGLPTPY